MQVIPIICSWLLVSYLPQLLHDTDTALSMLRARSLLVHLIHSLHTPAIAAAGGPRELLNLTRLLAAQDLANGSVPTSVWNSADGGPQSSHEWAIGLTTGEDQGEARSGSQRNNELADTAQPDQDSLLKVTIVGDEDA